VSSALPRLALVFHPRSFGTFALARSARAVCRLVWVIDSSVPELGAMPKLLRRLGEVIDVAGLSVEEAASRLTSNAPDGILALKDGQLPWTAAVAEQLGLAFVSMAAAERLMDKYAQRTALRAGGMPVPDFWAVPAPDDAQGWGELCADASFPAILKPRRSGGSRDVVRVESLDDLRASVHEIACRHGSSASRSLILERYLPDRPLDRGREFAGYISVESIVSYGRASHLAITGRFPPAEPFRETGFFIPSALGHADTQSVLAAAAQAIASLGVTIGTLHTEIKLTPDGPRVIEVNGRMGGGTPEMLAAVTDVDLLGLAMRLALGERIVFDEMPRCSGVVYVLYAHAPVSMHRILSVEGIERLRSDPSVQQVLVNRGPGAHVDWHDGNWSHVLSVHGVVANHDELAALAARVENETRIRGD
jgi:biotin carboxylase